MNLPYLHKKSDNKGFSLVELIIVIAIMAVLAGVLAPALIKYIKKSRRTVDVDTAGKIQSMFAAAIADYDANTSVSGLGWNYSTAVAWNGNSTMPDPANQASWNVVDYVFTAFGGVPTSKVNKDYFFIVTYNAGTGEVSKVELASQMGPGGVSYELWPDSSAFLSMTN
ncbi:MAG: type II secretion system protein [Coprococcus sp.]